MGSGLDRIIVHVTCPTCGSRIGAPYVQVRSVGVFACGCGTVVDAQPQSVAAQALMGLAEDDAPAVVAPSHKTTPL